MKRIIYLFTLIIMTSCSLDIPLEDQVSDPDAVTTVIAAEKLLASAYKSYNNYNDVLEFTLMSDDFQPTQLLKKDVNLKWAYGWNEYGIIPLAKAEWEGNYATIMSCNALLERLPNVNAVTTEEIKQLQQIKNRALCLKAICYLRLLKVFSPAINSANANGLGFIIKDKVEKTEKGRVTIAESIAYIENILKQIEPTDLESSKVWLSNNAGEYIKAELAMWQGDYAKVITIAKPLYDNLSNTVFSATQFTNLWSNMPSSARVFAKDISDRSGEYYYNTLKSDNDRGEDYAVINEKIVYATADIRNNIYNTPATMFVSSIEPNKKVMRFGKYCRLIRLKTAPKYYEKYRVANLFFWLAEAYAQQDDIKNATTILNQFLTVRNADLVADNLTQSQLLEKISQEKQKEFVGEGERFFDLKRHKKMVQRYSTFNKKLKQIDAADYRWIFPIPTAEIRYNTACKQNAGWEHIK